MEQPIIWLTKLILAHLLTDFMLQPTSWIVSRNTYHFASRHLYFHGFITALVAFIMLGIQYWWVALIILVTHILIDAWKSYQQDRIIYFLMDQCFHLLVILACWYFAFYTPALALTTFSRLNTVDMWAVVTAFVFLTIPAGVFIGQATKGWRNEIENFDSLANAGKWIGIIERVLILILVLKGQFEAIGLLIAAKSIIRFSEKDRTEIKTEYLLIGTLMSIGIAIITGVLVVQLITR
jgi:hypothetical protein